MDTAPPLPRRFGRYTLLASLGRGGMAEVFLASYEPMAGARRLVAIKQILPELAEEPDFEATFLDEARVLMGLYHPNLDRIVEVGEVDGIPFMALDYVPGRDLSRVLHRHERTLGPLPYEVSVQICREVAIGLGHAHSRRGRDGRSLGIVHRDISPENIIVTFEGTVKLVDFGIARGTMRALVTEPGLIKGKPAYMAPEQLLGQTIDHRADLFALGILLYRITVGRHPFGVRSNDESSFARLLREVPAPPHLARADYPEALSLVVLRALEKDVRARYQSAEALAADLEGVMRELGWFPSERRLKGMMGTLFPQGMQAARRLADDPADTKAARTASRFAIEVDLEDSGSVRTAPPRRLDGAGARAPVDARAAPPQAKEEDEEATVTEATVTEATETTTRTERPEGRLPAAPEGKAPAEGLPPPLPPPAQVPTVQRAFSEIATASGVESLDDLRLAAPAPGTDDDDTTAPMDTRLVEPLDEDRYEEDSLSDLVTQAAQQPVEVLRPAAAGEEAGRAIAEDTAVDPPPLETPGMDRRRPGARRSARRFTTGELELFRRSEGAQPAPNPRGSGGLDAATVALFVLSVVGLLALLLFTC